MASNTCGWKTVISSGPSQASQWFWSAHSGPYHVGGDHQGKCLGESRTCSHKTAIFMVQLVQLEMISKVAAFVDMPEFGP